MHLTVDKIHKRFGKKEVLSNVSFQMKEGEIVALMGESGCGKSTLLRIIAGFEQSDGGQIQLRDEEIQALAPNKRKVGMFFQDYALFPHMTVFENIAYGIRKRPDYKKKVQELIELCEISGLENAYPDKISGGQKQRVALARALAPDPDILLLDEPFSNIDTLLRESLRWELKKLLQGRKLSVILVSHDVEDAIALADKAIILHEGKIVQEGAVQELYSSPHSQFVAEFVGENNALNGAFKEGKFYSEDLIIAVADRNVDKETVELSVRPEGIRLMGVQEGLSHFSIEDILFKRFYTEIVLQCKGTYIKVYTSDKINRKRGDVCSLEIIEYHCFKSN